jgi:Arc/MetJ-type ribon-helix-helix transcriptional regulator
MTDMKRISIAIPDELDDRILALRKTDEFIRCSYSEIVRQIIERGLTVAKTDTQPSA